LIDAVSSGWAVDQERVYVSGTSNGGFMALRLAQELSDRVAAVASVAAGMPAVPACGAPENPVSVLFMNGTDDNHMPYGGGYLSNPPDPAHGSVLSTPDSVRYWVDFNLATVDPLVHVFPDLDPEDGGIVERFTHGNGREATEVVLYRVNGGGHSAPSIRERYSALFERYFNRQNHDVEMTAELWRFFRDKTLH
jgi:polyhydroxybutyrate depolymerase